LHHEPPGAGIHDTDGAQRQQGHCLHHLARPYRVLVDVIIGERPDQRFIKGAEQRCGTEGGILYRQMAGAHCICNPGCNFAGDGAAARQTRGTDIDIHRLGEHAPGQLAL